MTPIMKNLRKLILAPVLCLVAFALLAVPVPVSAGPIPESRPLVQNLVVPLSTTLVVCSNTTAGTYQGAFFRCPDARPATIQVVQVGTNATTSTTTYKLCPSVDGRHADTANPFTFTLAMSGTTEKTVTTNITATILGAAPYWMLYSVQNAHTASIRVSVFAGAVD